MVLHEIAQRGSNRTAAEQAELVRRSVNDSLKTPDPAEGWAKQHTVYTQILMESFDNPVRSALVQDKRLQDKMEALGFHGVAALAVAIEAELNSAAAFGTSSKDGRVKKTCANCQKPNHTKAECTREGGGRFKRKTGGGGATNNHKSNGRESKRSSNSGSNLTCFACKEVGHKAQDCPRNMASISNMSVRRTTRHRRSSSQSSESDEEPLAKKNKKVKQERQEESTCKMCRGGPHLIDDCPTVAALRAAQGSRRHEWAIGAQPAADARARWQAPRLKTQPSSRAVRAGRHGVR